MNIPDKKTDLEDNRNARSFLKTRIQTESAGFFNGLLDSGFCVECMEQALQVYGIPDIFNTDQGSQFTSEAFTGVLKAHGITISMDGRGRALDNIFVERLWRSLKVSKRSQ